MSTLKYEQDLQLTGTDFRRRTGGNPIMFAEIEVVLHDLEAGKRKSGRPPAPPVVVQLLLTLEFWREYRTFIHLGQAWDIHESTVHAGQPVPAGKLERLPDTQLPSGASPIAEGVTAQVSQCPSAPDPRDLLGVDGWNDKVLRLLSRLLDPRMPILQKTSEKFSQPVVWLGTAATYAEVSAAVRIVSASYEVLYDWNKGDVWAAQTLSAAELK